MSLAIAPVGGYLAVTGRWSQPAWVLLAITLAVATYNAATDTQTTSNSTVTGAAIQVKGNPSQYERLKLTEFSPATLLFAPDTLGDTPPLGATVPWGGSTQTVKSVDPLAPDGSTILARVVIA